MIIERLELKNYRQFRDQKIVFALGEDNRRITVIQGANGAGKTNILNAITWCLYGEEKYLSDRDKGLPIVNTIKLSELEPEGMCTVKIQLVFRYDEKKKLIVKRTVRCRKISNRQAEELDPEFRVFYQTNGDMEPSKDPTLTVRQHLPKDIQEYFFFHCERLDDYFKGPANSRLIRKEVFKISQLALFENVYNHLKKMNDEYAKELRSINPEADHIKKTIDDKRNQLEELGKLLEKYKDEDKKAEQMEKELRDRLKSYPTTEELKEAQKLRESLESKLERSEQRIGELQENYKDYLIQTGPIIMVYEALSYMKERISIKDAAGLIPPPFRRDFLKQLLDTGVCICEEDLSENAKARKKVEKLFQDCDRITDISNELSVDLSNIKAMRRDLKSFRKNCIANAKDINEKQKDIEELSTQLRRISDKFLAVDDEKISMWESQLNAIVKRRRELIERSAIKQQESRDLNNEILRLDKEYKKELKKIHKHSKLRKRLLFCEEAMDAATEIKDEIMEGIRHEIEELTESQFLELIWKKVNFKTIRINEGYEISVLDQNDIEAIGTLSDGERQVLALSFIAALNRISGFDAPIVIDTPLGRISKEPKSNIAEKLPNYLKDKQLTLLVTEEEYTQEVRRKISEHVGKEYKIRFEETVDGNEAEVISYGTRRA